MKNFEPVQNYYNVDKFDGLKYWSSFFLILSPRECCHNILQSPLKSKLCYLPNIKNSLTIPKILP